MKKTSPVGPGAAILTVSDSSSINVECGVPNNLIKWQGWSHLKNITTDTLVITGERDNYFPRYVFDDVVKMIPNADVYDVGSAKHKVQLERYTAVNRAIERFIENTQRSSWREQSDKDTLIKRRPWLRSYDKDNQITIKTYDTGIEHDVALGRADAFVMDRLSALELIKKTGLPLQLAGKPFETIENAWPFVDNEKGHKLQGEVNKALAAMRADGTLNTISQKWFGADITQ